MNDSAQTSTPQRFAFVNVDGVLTNAKTYWAGGPEAHDKIDRGVLAALAKFCRKLDVKVVIASSWSINPNAQAWQAMFAACGVDLPVTDALPLKNFDWFSDAENYMQAHPGADWVLFEDHPEHLSPCGQHIAVDAMVGLTTSDLYRAALVLAPESSVAADLAGLAKSFGPNPTIGVSVNGGPLREVPLSQIANIVSSAP